MLRVTETKVEMTLRDTPIMRWALTLLFTIFGGWMLYQSRFLGGKDISVSATGILIPLVTLVLAGYEFFTTTVTTTTINKYKKILTVKKRGLLKNSFSSYQFSEIDGFPFVEATSNTKGIYYSIQLPLKTGEQTELAARRFLNKKTYLDAVNRANRYLFYGSNKDLFKLTILDDD